MIWKNNKGSKLIYMKKKFLLKLYLSETVFIIMIFVINYIIKIKRFIYSIK